MGLSGLLGQARRALVPRMKQAGATRPGGPADRIVLFFSLSDAASRARVCHAVAADFDVAWEQGAARAARLAEEAGLQICWLRVDWVTSAQATTWASLKARLARNKRNYFRHGLAVGHDFTHAFLEQELNANAMLYGGVKVPVARLNENNFNRYARRRYGKDTRLDFSDDAPVIVFGTQGLFVASEGSPVPPLPGGQPPWWLNGPGRNAGRRSITQLRPDDLRALIASGSAFLARQVQADGKFVYGYFPCFGRPIRNYNTLRHASTIYAMLEAWELTQDTTLFDAIRRGLHYLTTAIIRHYPQPDGTALAFNVEVNDEIKLGANAVSILALVKYTELTQDDRHLPLMEALALGVTHMQCPDTGRFDHVLNADDLSVKQTFRIIYYDGEAAFGLMRLYGLTGDARWLKAVEQAFDHFIEAGHHKAHDHWLSYCANELTLYKSEERYFRFGVQNIADHLDFIHRRLTTYPTLLELSMAFHEMLQRLKQYPDKQHVLKGLDVDKFYRALHHRAHYLLNGFFWPELAMYFARPDTIVGSFFIRHHSFRVRIDDVEHYLSGLVAYRKMLASQQASDSGGHATGPSPLFAALRKPFVANWTADTLARASGGSWQTAAPHAAWRATGVSFAATAQQPGHVVMVRSEAAGNPMGVLPSALPRLPFVPQAILAEPDTLAAVQQVCHGPILTVASLDQALEGLATFARGQMAGPVIGVTGSAGKTTACAMLAHVLRAWGGVGSSRLSANTFRGLAWNMASMPWNSDYFVLEMAIGGMARATRMARPQIAVVISIGPAHLQYHQDTLTIARRKARLFDGMAAGDTAIINLDMLHADVFLDAASQLGLYIIGFSRLDAEAGLVGRITDPGTGDLVIVAGDTRYVRRLPGLTPHMLDNVLAVLGVVQALDLDLDHALHQLATFRPLPGRGARLRLSLGDRTVYLIDETYNANPLSMKAALASFRQFSVPGEGVLLLADMLELDQDAATLHKALIPHIVAARPRLTGLVGRCMSALAPLLEGNVPTLVFEDADQAWSTVAPLLNHEETLLMKGSNAMGLNRLVRELARQSGR